MCQGQYSRRVFVVLVVVCASGGGSVDGSVLGSPRSPPTLHPATLRRDAKKMPASKMVLRSALQGGKARQALAIFEGAP